MFLLRNCRVTPVRTGDLVTVVFVMKRVADDVWIDTKAKVTCDV